MKEELSTEIWRLVHNALPRLITALSFPLQGTKLTFLARSRLAPKFSKVVAKANKLGAIKKKDSWKNALYSSVKWKGFPSFEVKCATKKDISLHNIQRNIWKIQDGGCWHVRFIAFVTILLNRSRPYRSRRFIYFKASVRGQKHQGKIYKTQRILVANLATNFWILVASAIILVALATVLGAISCPALLTFRCFNLHGFSPRLKPIRVWGRNSRGLLAGFSVLSACFLSLLCAMIGSFDVIRLLSLDKVITLVLIVHFRSNCKPPLIV